MDYQDIKEQDRLHAEKLTELMQVVNRLKSSRKKIKRELSLAKRDKLERIAKKFCDDMQYGSNAEHYQYNNFGCVAFKIPSEPYNDEHADLRQRFMRAWYEMNHFIAERAQRERENFVNWIVEKGDLK